MQYYILTASPNFKAVVYWLQDHNVKLAIHLNRTRWTLDPDTRLHTEFCLRWLWACAEVDDELDLATGLPKYSVDHIS